MVADTMAMSHRTLHGTSEENLATREVYHKVLTDRHEHLLNVIPDPILRELIEAHGPQGGWDATCAACDPVYDEYDSEPASWPCVVWTFVSDRL